jgi:DNA helicase II / ATP-dependent DNA helicase PcrA
MRLLPPASSSQLAAAADPTSLILIEAGPGSGKTATAAERFGYLAYDRRVVRHRGVLVLSFTVAATAAIRGAIRSRWGGSALDWPNRCRTFDSTFRDLLQFLIRTGTIMWPGGPTEIVGIEDWRKRQPANNRKPLAWVPILKDRNVVGGTRKVDSGDLVVTAKKRLMPQLSEGLCTHESVRELVLAAIRDEEIRLKVVTYLASTTSCILVDEVFDANETDILLLRLFHEAGCSMTLVGDPWQALYGFRDAQPELVKSNLIVPLGFTSYLLEDCYRFANPLRGPMERLRAGQPFIDIPCIEAPSVVLAAEWALLWLTTARILPLAFGQVRTRLDAAMVLLLDLFAESRDLAGARLTGGACNRLGVSEPEWREGRSRAFGPVLEVLKEGGPSSASDALVLLSRAPKEHLGAAAKLSIGEGEVKRYIPQLESLGERVRYEGMLVAGMTVHQAKGGEWDRVAVLLSDDDISALGTGLIQSDRDHRRLYVALTRARQVVGTLAP